MKEEDFDLELPAAEIKHDSNNSQKIHFQAPPGMHDLLPEDFALWEKLRSIIFEESLSFGFSPIETSLVEQTALFEKGIGERTDIVQKEMYNLITKGGDKLTLRPEATAGIMRAYFQHGMISMMQPVKLFTFGPMFRHERQQAGRFRSFHQFNIEIIGSNASASDFEVIHLVNNILAKRLGLKDIIFEVSSIGDKECRPEYEKTLKGFLKNKKNQLCANCKNSISARPLRIFDCKDEKCARVAALAPKIIDHLCKYCFKHFKDVLEFLDEFEIPYNLNPGLVRGLEYYTRTVFETRISSSENESLSKLSLAGGGRYDDLGDIIGGRHTPATGGAIGIERIVEILKQRKFNVPVLHKPKVFFAQLGFLAKKRSFKLFKEFLKNKIVSVIALEKDSLKSQMKMADRLKVPWTIIIGQKEVLEENVIVRDMTLGTQEIISQKKIINYIKNKLKK